MQALGDDLMSLAIEKGDEIILALVHFLLLVDKPLSRIINGFLWSP
jgi:hypothetical protein